MAARRRARCRTRIVERHVAERTTPPVERRAAVVMITYNRRDEVVCTLQHLADLPERPAVVVVDNASTDGTSTAVRRAHPWVDLLVLERNIGASARNIAVRLLDTPYVAFADDDSWWAPGSISVAADVLDRHTEVAVVTARIVIEPGGTEDPIVRDLEVSPLPNEPSLPGLPLLSVMAGASMVRRSAFEQVGGFEPRLKIGGEEELLSLDLAAAGWALRYIPQLTVHHAASAARDAHRRRADGLRNTLWVMWLRRPVGHAARRSFNTLRRAPHDRVTGRAALRAMVGIPWVVRERRLLPGSVAEGLRLLDEQQLNSRARRYVS